MVGIDVEQPPQPHRSSGDGHLVSVQRGVAAIGKVGGLGLRPMQALPRKRQRGARSATSETRWLDVATRDCSSRLERSPRTPNEKQPAMGH